MAHAKCDSAGLWQLEKKRQKQYREMGTLHTGHPNMSCSQIRSANMPRMKSKLDSKSLHTPSDLRSLFYIIGYAILRTVALKQPILLTEKRVR
jgi:hypothetical protein